jgi:catechol 2,3-dioxygenase-like lactoylglutathione lyase family enzyme
MKPIPGALQGIHHGAFVMWDPVKTVPFYRDVLGFPIVHTITAKGWGQGGHADFAHVFFDVGNRTCLAFFYYFGVPPRDESSKTFVENGRHTAFSIASEAELIAWRERLVQAGVNVSPPIRHELVESIYFTDPNGYPLEITRSIRPMTQNDALDAALTVQALVESVETGANSAQDMWQRKARLVSELSSGEGRKGTATLYVLDVPEFAPMVEAARKQTELAVTHRGTHFEINAAGAMTIERSATGLERAIWFGALTGGFAGKIERFDDTELRLIPA